MRSEFRLIDICRLIVDCPHSTPKWTEQGVVVLRNQYIKNGRLNLSNPSFTDEENYLYRTRRARPQSKDIVLTREAPIGELCQIPSGLKCCLGQRQVLIRPDSEKVDANYLFYVLRSPTVQNEMLLSEGSGSTVSNLRIPLIEGLKIELPSIKEQVRVSRFLKSLESTIDTLEAQNSILEAIAQTLFRSWFVNFDPVHAKAAGRIPEGMSPELAALFPSEFVESELGMIPKGWGVCGLEKFAHLNQKSWGKTEHPDLISYLDLSSVKKNNIDTPHAFLYEEAPSRARRVLRKGDSIFGTVRPGNLSYGYISDEVESLTGSTGFAVLTPKREELRAFVYCCMTDPSNVERLTHQADGAAYPAVNPSVVLEQELATPTHQELFTRFGKICNPLFEQIGINRDLSINLTCLRDELLPRLISGKLRIEEAEEAVSEVLGSIAEEENTA